MAVTLNASTTAGLVQTADTSGVLALQTAGTTAVTVDASQNVGIGTSSPSTKLTVYDATAPQVTFDNGTSTFIVGNNAGGNNKILYGTGAHPIIFYTNATEAVRIDSSGKLLLGVTSGTGLSNGDFAMANGNHIRFRNAANSAYISAFEFTSANGLNIGTGGSLSTITFGISGIGTAATFDTSGNLLVGTISALSQTGKATFVGTGNGLVTQVGNSSTAYQSTNTSGTSAYYAAIFSNNGNTFSTCGTIQVSGTTTSYNTSSDYRLKEDVQPMTGALAKVALLKPVTYKWKSDETDGEGFIAHELAEVCPQAVSGEKDGLKADGSIMPQGIDTSFLVATLTAAMQEQQALITQLQADVAALKGASA